jgi:hypothetical protein
LFRPAESFFRILNQDCFGKKFGFCSGDTANKKPRKWFFYLLEEVSKLLCLRLGIEQQGHVFLARKTDELAYCSAEHGLE